MSVFNVFANTGGFCNHLARKAGFYREIDDATKP